MNRYPYLCSVSLLLGAALLLQPTAQATVIEQDNQLINGSYSVLAPQTGEMPGDTDLLDGKTALLPTGNFQLEGSAGATVLTDGSFGQMTGNGTATSYSATGGPAGGTSVTYSLGTNLLGYNLSDVAVYSGWNDNGRYQQAYTLEYSLAATPTIFHTLYTVADYPTGNPYVGTNAYNGASTAFYSSSGSLKQGVADVRFDFNSVANGYTGYRELVINGSPRTSIPEPSSLALILGGILILGWAVKRKRARG